MDYKSPEYEWLSDQMKRISAVVWDGSTDPNAYLASLSKQEQCLFYVMAFESRAGNGGLTSYLCGSYGDDAPICAKYLGEIGALKAQDVLVKAVAMLPDHFNNEDMDLFKREEIVFSFCDEHGVKYFEEVLGIEVNEVLDDIKTEELYRYCKPVSGEF